MDNQPENNQDRITAAAGHISEAISLLQGVDDYKARGKAWTVADALRKLHGSTEALLIGLGNGTAAKLLLILAMLLFALPSRATIAVSGNLKTGNTAAVTAGTFVRFTLKNCGSNQPLVNGTALLAPNGGNAYYVDFIPNATGAIHAASGPDVLYSTSEVSCGGHVNVIWYSMQIFVNGRPGPESSVDASQDINVNAPTLLSSNPVADLGTSVLQGYVFTQATGATTWAINHNLNAAVSVEFFDASGALFWPNTIVQTSSNILTATFTTPQTGTAVIHKAGVIALASNSGAILSNPNTNQTINGAFSLTLDTVSAKKLNSLRFADQFTGAVTAQIDNCLADFTTGVCVIPSTMGAGNPTTPIASGKMLLDFRTAGALGLWFGGDSAANVLSRFTSSPGTVGFVDLNTGLHIHSSLDVSAGSISMRQPGSYLALHNGNFNLAETTGKYGYIQAGDTTSGNPAWNANNTLTLPDLAQGGSSDASGYLLGAATAQLVSGNCLFASAGGGPGAGAMNDSGIGCNTQIDFPTPNNRFVRWNTGGFALALTGNAVSANRTATLPDASGNVVLDSATQTLSGKTFSDSVTVQSANGAQWVRGQASELLTLSTSGTTTDTAANLLPANSIIEAVVARVTTTITTATDWKLGDSTQAARFTLANSTLTAGTTTVGLNQADPTVATANLGPVQSAAAKVRVTTTGTPGAGVIRITVFYRQFVAPTS